ncbi:MAG: hypothetical protein V4639_15710 [Pseudomonadota bacterium]
MSNKFIRFLKLREITPSGLDGHRYRMGFEVGEKRGDTFHPLQMREVEIQVSGTLQAIWGKSDSQMSAYSGTSAASHILDLAKKNSLDALDGPLLLNTYTAPKTPPESPQVQPGLLIPVEEAPNLPEPRTFSFLSDDISELRDQINALSKDLWGDRLLLLSQERPLFDMYKSAQTADEFRLRVQSLGIIAKDLNRALLRQVAGVTPDVQIGDFVLLERAIHTLPNAGSAEAIGAPLKQLNNLRQGYPTHGDNAKMFLEAHRYFGLTYPVTDFSVGWESVLAKYFESIRSLRDVLSAEWNKRGGK